MAILKFQKLTPTDTVDLNAYEEGFKFIFENEDIRNIAISGPYSSGKSSLLESYKAKHKSQKFLHISLAHFTDVNKTDGFEQNTEDVETVIEGKILNQLIQQISINNIPQTNFRIKKKISKVSTVLWTIGSIIMLTLGFILFNLNKYTSWIGSYPDDKWKIPWLKELLLYFTSPIGVIVSSIIVMALMGGALYRIVDSQRNKSFLKRISVQGNEIEIFEDSKESYFDKYLNEVLYLFENAGVDVIVFEDIDRFENVRIFERLREINMLTNIRLKQNKKNKPIRFFYLLRDDIFITKDRAKFFDYILPVVPVLDSSNSYDKIKELFSRAECVDTLNERFLKGLSLYIDDLRVLKNIYNEFLIYYERLKKVDLDPNKLLAMITYKNLFPRDFAGLQLNQGFVFSLFAHKDNFVHEEILSIESEIEELKKRLEKSKTELTENERELIDLKAARSQRARTSYNYEARRAYEKWERDEYPVRFQALRDRSNEQQAELQNRLHTAEQKRMRIAGCNLAEIITRDNIDTIFQITTRNDIGIEENYYDVKGSDYFDLLKYLIRYGYIDESYSDYMTYFYANSLTLNDKMFLRAVNDKKAKEYTYSLNSPSLVLSNLIPLDFLQEETLNYSLLNFLLGTENDKNKECLEALADQVIEKKPFEFLAGFFDTNQHRPEFVVWLNNIWPDYFLCALKGMKLSDNLLWWYCLYSVAYCEEDILVAMNNERILTRFVEKQPDFLKKTDVSKDQLINVLEKLEVRFEKIQEESDPELLEKAYNLDLYVINVDNISLFLKCQYNLELAEVKHHILTTLATKKEQGLYRYLYSELNEAVVQVLLISDNSIDDAPETVAAVINSDVVHSENINKYIRALTRVLPSLQEIEGANFRDALLESRKIEATGENMVEYFSKQGITKTLIHFINGTDEAIDFSSVSNPTEIEKFAEKVLTCSDIIDYHYEAIISCYGKEITQFDHADVEISKMKILIDKGILVMNAHNITFIRDHYPEVIFDFIRKNIEEYCAIVKNGQSNHEETTEVLKWEVLTIGQAEDIIDYTGGTFSVVANHYPDDIMLYLMENNFEEDDIKPLTINYSNYKPEIQNVIQKLAVSRVHVLCSIIKEIDSCLIFDLLNNAQLGKNCKIELLVSIIETAKTKDVHDALNVAGYKELAKLFEENKRPRIVISEEHGLILDALKKHRHIGSYEPDSTSSFYRVKRLRNNKNVSIPTSLL